MSIEYFSDFRSHVREYADHKMLNRNIFVVHALCRLFGGADNAVGLRREIHLAAGNLRESSNIRIKLAENGVAVNAHLAEQGGDEPAVLIEQRVEQMLGDERLVVVLSCYVLRVLYCLNGLLSIVLSVHKITCLV